VGYASMARGFLEPSYPAVFLIATIGSLLFIPYVFLMGFNGNDRRVLLRAMLPSWMAVKW
jgi:hypothetical protein